MWEFDSQTIINYLTKRAVWLFRQKRWKLLLLPSFLYDNRKILWTSYYANSLHLVKISF
jgi:hypothetical protein